ncbi:MAG: ABC transporter permease [Lachnospiraceae bacterium]|nr:ABC transporter permease [Lachnospiraceae bacterium]
MKSSLIHILKKELRELFRDRKSLGMMLIIPVLIPFLVLGMSAMFDMQIEKSTADYSKIGFAYEMDKEEMALAEQMNIEAVTGGEEELKKKCEEGELYCYVTSEGTAYTIHHDGSEDAAYAVLMLNEYFNAYKEQLQRKYLQERKVEPSAVLDVLSVQEELLGEDNFFVTDYVQNYAFLFIIMAIVVSATYPATDTTAGEKERGTLETLLSFPIRSRDIIVGKFLCVAMSSAITGLISLLLTVISLMAAEKMFAVYEGMHLLYSGVTILFAILVILAFSLFISGLCIAVASTKSSFKEAQSALTPFTFIAFFPGMVAFMAGLEGSPLTALVPFMNYTLIFTDIVSGKIDWLNIVLMFGSTIVYISVALAFIIRQYTSEKVLFSR